MKTRLMLVLALTSSTALAEGTRQLDSHEHGVGALNIAVAGQTVVMEFRAPGADIVGFEYTAKSDEDRAAIDTAVAALARPLDLFVLPAAAECTVVKASAELESEDDHDGHDHGDHAENDKDHGHDDGHDDHAEDGHDDEHDHAHDEHAEDDHDHAHDDDHAAEDSHTEFHAEYVLSCGAPDALTQITFAYFEMFENARELEVQIVSEAGAQAIDVGREDPTLDLRGMF